LGIEEV